MKIKKVDRKMERQVLIGLITSRAYLATIRTKFKPSLLRNNYARTIASWCFEYFDKYDEAPLEKIQEIYEYHDKREEVKDDDIDLIEKLLEEVSDEYALGESLNVQFLIDKTEEYFNRVSIEQTVSMVEAELVAGNVNKAQEFLDSSKPIRLSSGNAIDPLADEEKIRSAFEQVTVPLFTLEGDFGKFINEHLTRDSFLAIQAPEKTGKTWMLYHLALEALKNRLKVAIFQIGDMTENQTIIRMSIAISGKSNKSKYCGTFKRPVKILSVPVGEGGELAVDKEEVTIKDSLTWEEAYSNCRKFYKQHRIRPEKRLRLITEPADTISIRGIESKLDELEKQDGFIPDVVVIDYMDILASENSSDIGRDKINNNWKRAKSLCNKKHILLLSATQADGDSYDGKVQTKKNFSEDKRKYAHINGMLGLNQNDFEKSHNIAKLNWIVLREGEFNTSNAVYILQNLRQGQPIVDSLLAGSMFEKKQVTHEKEKRTKLKKRKR